MATATANNVVEAQPRQDHSRGKNEARRVRAAGLIPAVLYGAKKPTVALVVDPKRMLQILHSDSGHNTIFDLQVGDERTKAMIVDWQYEPIKGHLLHVDLKRIAMDVRMKVKVPVKLLGVPEGVKTQGGILEQVEREIEVECLPGDIPSHIDVDVSHLVFGTVLRVSDLSKNDKIKVLTAADQTVAHIVSVKEHVEEKPAEVGVEGAAAAPAEPEVIKKGKQEAEEGAAEAEAAAPAKAEKAEKKEKKEK
ncbi:MAG TPA: 50S ribosomal protein L25 [Terriglobales bacterium]|nr:50S ribosomal protein L25 [Terriglobales bacterium]